MKDEITVDGIQYVKKSVIATTREGKEWVIIRSDRAGVHYGILESKRDAIQGLEVTLRLARRVFYWEGAASLSQMAVHGISKPESSKVSMTVDSIIISGVIEIIPIEDSAFNNLFNQPIWKV